MKLTFVKLLKTGRRKILLHEIACIFMELSKSCGKLLLKKAICSVKQVLE